VDLVQFLRDRLDEDEQTALAATQGEWVWSREFVTPPGYHHRTVGPLEPGDAWFIARQNPARILAEVEAKRRIVDLAAGMLAAAKGDSEVDHYGGLSAAEETLPLLAHPFRDHPDFNPAWLEN
jgi:hypothetical protein